MATFLSSTITIRISQNVSSSTRHFISIREAIFLTKNHNLGSTLPLYSSNPKSYLHTLSTKHANLNFINEKSYMSVKDLENFRRISTSSLRASPPNAEIPKFQPNISTVRYLPPPSTDSLGG